MATFQNNKKKTSFHTKLDYFSCMAKFSMTDSGTLPHLRGSSLQQLVAVESSKELHLMCLRPIGVIFASCCGNSNIFSGKIKIGWKWPWLEGGLGYFFCFGDVSFFRKRQLCVTNILLHFENQLQKWKFVSLSISSSGTLLTEPTLNMCSEKCCQ